MTDYTNDWALPKPESTDLIAGTASNLRLDLAALADKADQSFTSLQAIVRDDIQAARWDKTVLWGTSDIDALYGPESMGVYRVPSVSAATDLGLPFPSLGTITVQFLRPTTGDQTMQVWETVQGVRYFRWYTGTEWSEWNTYHWMKGLLPSDSNINDWIGADYRGSWRIINDTVASSITGLPVGTRGNLTIYDHSTQVTIQEYRTTSGVYYRSCSTTGVWDDWDRLATVRDLEALEDSITGTTGGTQRSSSSGFKVVPLALTAGRGTSVDVGTSGAMRFPIRFNAPITRWRLHIGNIDPRIGEYEPGTWTIPGVYLGEATSPETGFTDGMQKIAEGTVPDGGDYTTPWMTHPIGGNIERVLSFAWEGTTSPVGIVGGGWRSNYSNDADAAAPSLLPADRAPFHVWIEAETYAHTPVVATVGSSTSAGVGSSLPMYNSTLSRLGRERGFLPVHYTRSGDTIAASLDPTHYKWSCWAHLDKPDAVLNQLGSNDVFASVTLGTMQNRHTELMKIIHRQLSTTVFDTTLFPRTIYEGSQEDVRRAYNIWLQEQQNGVRAVFDFVTPVSDDDETLKPDMDYDGIHINDLGMRALADAVDQPISSPVVMPSTS